MPDALEQLIPLPDAPDSSAAFGSSGRNGHGRRLKVVQLTDRVGTHGGAEHLTMQIAERLDPARFESIVCATRFSDSEREKETVEDAAVALRAAGVRFLGLDRRTRAHVHAWWPLVRLLRRERVDVIHAHKFGSNIWGVVFGRLCGVPVVVTHEHGWSFEGGPKMIIDRELIARGSNAFIAVSREDRRRMIELERIDPETAVFVPNGIPALGPPSGNDVRAELGIGSDDRVVTSVGFLRQPKAMDVLIEAAARIAPQFPSLKVLIVGEGDDRPVYEALIDRLGVRDTVKLIGLRSDVPDLLRASDAAVLSTNSEGSPLSVMEYMDAGLATVATRVGGIPDLIDDGVEGLLVDPQDPVGLGDALARVLSDRDEARRMGERARERRRREFDIDVMVENLQNLYLELYAKTRRGRRDAAVRTSARSARR
jgi:glycosyltransferase involved in cell wall biosynthesis